MNRPYRIALFVLILVTWGLVIAACEQILALPPETVDVLVIIPSIVFGASYDPFRRTP